MSSDRDEAATGINPDDVLDAMQRATQNVRDQAWKLQTSTVISLVEDEVEQLV